MALTKERKVLLGLLGSAGLILAVDQLLLSPPRGAQAQPAQDSPSAAPASQGAADAKAQAEASASQAADGHRQRAIAAWNERLLSAAGADDGPTPDPFAPPAQERPAMPGLLSPAEFKSAHKLTAVMNGGDVAVAMVNGRAVRVGEEVSGYRLRSVDARSASFEAGGQVVVLELPVQPIGGG